jgi:hypothetical protein
MPRINDQILESIFYLYPSVEEAERGERVGGTGFFIWVETENYKPLGHTHAVTNRHIIEGGSTVIRLNNHDGTTTIKPLALNQWILHPHGADLAIAYLPSPNKYEIKYRGIRADLIMSKEKIPVFDIGPGDDVYVVGRFTRQDGGNLNLPCVRSGVISMMPHKNMASASSHDEPARETFLVEMRSLPGFSGSPVIWQLPLLHPAVWHLERPQHKLAAHPDMPIGPWLLGIDCEYLYYDVEVYDERGNKYIKHIHSGYSIVIPAWELVDLLNDERLVIERNKAEEMYRVLIEQNDT